MPTSRPKDRNQDKSQWWKEGEKEDAETNRDPRDPKTDSRMGKNKFMEEQHPTQRPT
jgi:hypothetical protein